MRALITFLVNRGLVVNLISIFVVALGLYSMLNINREAFPNVNLDLIQINTNYPGATPEEIERLVITPIEQEVQQLTGIDRMISVSFPGSGRITLELDPDASNRDRIVSDVSLAVDRASLPDDLPFDPYVLEIDGAVFPIIQLGIAADRDELALKRLGDHIYDDLVAIDGVGKVVIQGKRKAEIRVTVKPDELKKKHIGIGQIAESIRRWNVTAPGGDMETPEGQKVVRIVGEFRDAKDMASLVLRANERGGGVRLADVAEVRESLVKPQTIYDISGEPGLSLIVMKKADADIIDTVDKIAEYVKGVRKRYGDDVKVTMFNDMSRFTRLRLGVLTNNGLVGLVLVFISLLLFLRPSVALTTTWGLPIVFFAGLAVLYLSGVTLNLISMMGFIMVLGMLVDDAIIIGENITWHMERGLEPLQAAAKGAVELIGPVTTTILTTIAAFLPLAFMTGMIGKFIIAIPIVVITLLVFSWAEAFFILPNHVADFTRTDKHPGERRWLVWLERVYGGVLKVAIKLRWLTVALSFAILIGSVWLARTHMSFQLFPPFGVDQFLVRITAPPGTSVYQMRKKLVAVDAEIRKHIKPEYLDATILKSGQISVDEGDPLTQRGGRFGQIRVLYLPAVARPGHEVLDDMRVIEAALAPLFPDLEIAYTEIKPGPPTGRSLEAEISSHDPQAAEQAARKLIKLLENTKGVTTVDSGLIEGDPQVLLRVDRSLATYAGIDLATIATHIRAAVGGLVVSTTRRGSEEIDLTIRYPDNPEKQMEMLRQVLIPNARGGLVPLEKIARLVQEPGLTTIRHIDGIRVVSVIADVDNGQLTSLELNRMVQKKQAQWAGDKVQVNYGGEEEKSQESFKSLFVAFGFAVVGIFFILAIQFNNLGYPLIVMLAIPFGAVGVILSFYLHDLYWKPMPLSFFSTMGMVALTGVVVNSSLVLLVFVQRAIREGMDRFEAIQLAGRRRLRAVLLTAATTVLGLLPTAYGWGGMDHFVAPMALALSWGLAFATLVTLFTIPAALGVAFDVTGLFGRLFKRKAVASQ